MLCRKTECENEGLNKKYITRTSKFLHYYKIITFRLI